MNRRALATSGSRTETLSVDSRGMTLETGTEPVFFQRFSVVDHAGEKSAASKPTRSAGNATLLREGLDSPQMTGSFPHPRTATAARARGWNSPAGVDDGAAEVSFMAKMPAGLERESIHCAEFFETVGIEFFGGSWWDSTLVMPSTARRSVKPRRGLRNRSGRAIRRIQNGASAVRGNGWRRGCR